jgi:signal transduction histidine kinase
MKRRLPAGANLVIAGLGALLLLVLLYVPRDPFAGVATYLPFHIFAESSSIIVSVMIFAVMWNAHSFDRSSGLVLLACAMLGAGLLDFGHMLSVSGMPRFVTESGPDKGIAFWLAARMLAAAGLVLGALRLQRPVTSPRWRYLPFGIVLIITALVYWAVLFHQDSLPLFFIDGTGLTRTKIGAEIFITAILFIPAIAFYRMARDSNSPMHVGLYLAASVCILSELFFAIYIARHDFFQVLGHAYKVVAYLCIYRAIFIQGIREPFELLRQEVAERTLAQEEVGRRKHAQEALEKSNQQLEDEDRRKNGLIAMISHELRNPLGPIANSLLVLERSESGSEHAKLALAVIGRQVEQLTRLVEDLLDITRIAHDKIQLDRQRLNLSELVARSAEDMRPVFEKNGVRLESNISSPDVVVNGDKGRLTQVLGNLLQNAAKFTPRGGNVLMALEAVSGGAVLKLTDTGIGIQGGMLSQVFQPFAQDERGRDHRRGGLGLGLALVKGLVELHGGEVTAHSEGPGKGAQFVISLPLDKTACGPMDA